MTSEVFTISSEQLQTLVASQQAQIEHFQEVESAALAVAIRLEAIASGEQRGSRDELRRLAGQILAAIAAGDGGEHRPRTEVA